ncbi:MAG: hypothetical protein AAGH15_11460 [Myxococcota bacterium]
MRIRYAIPFALLLLGLGLAMFVMGVLIAKPMTMGLGALNGFVGVLMLVQPTFVVHPDKVDARNLIGMTMKSYPFALASLRVEGKRVLPPEGKKPTIGGFWARGSDMDALIAAIEDAKRARA